MPEFQFGEVCVVQSSERGESHWLPNTLALSSPLNSIEWNAFGYCKLGCCQIVPGEGRGWQIALFGSPDNINYFQITAWNTCNGGTDDRHFFGGSNLTGFENAPFTIPPRRVEVTVENTGGVNHYFRISAFANSQSLGELTIPIPVGESESVSFEWLQPRSGMVEGKVWNSSLLDSKSVAANFDVRYVRAFVRSGANPGSTTRLKCRIWAVDYT